MKSMHACLHMYQNVICIDIFTNIRIHLHTHNACQYNIHTHVRTHKAYLHPEFGGWGEIGCCRRQTVADLLQMFVCVYVCVCLRKGGERRQGGVGQERRGREREHF